MEKAIKAIEEVIAKNNIGDVLFNGVDYMEDDYTVTIIYEILNNDVLFDTFENYMKKKINLLNFIEIANYVEVEGVNIGDKIHISYYKDKLRILEEQMEETPDHVESLLKFKLTSPMYRHFRTKVIDEFCRKFRNLNLDAKVSTRRNLEKDILRFITDSGNEIQLIALLSNIFNKITEKKRLCESISFFRRDGRTIVIVTSRFRSYMKFMIEYGLTEHTVFSIEKLQFTSLDEDYDEDELGEYIIDVMAGRYNELIDNIYKQWT